MRYKTVLVLGALLALPATATPPPPPDRLATEYFADASGRNLPFSEAVRAGNLLFLSGEIGTKPGTLDLVPGGIAPEARQTMENIKAKLLRRGASMNDVVKCTVFLADMKDWPAFNEIYRAFFPANLPARSALGANGLALGARVEVECVAFAPPAAPPR
jgi:2-iminobutanoate/2-iminopropanoate deaminase